MNDTLLTDRDLTILCWTIVALVTLWMLTGIANTARANAAKRRRRQEAHDRLMAEADAEWDAIVYATRDRIPSPEPIFAELATERLRAELAAWDRGETA